MPSIRALLSIITRVRMMEWEAIHAMKLGITYLTKTQMLWNIRYFNYQTMILKVINVGMSFIKSQILLVIRAFILKRKIIIVVNIVKVVISLKCIQTKQKCCKHNTCGKVLSKSSSLNRHRPIHIGRKPFKCTECDKAFGNQALLNINEFILGRSHKHAKSVAKPLAAAQNFIQHQVIHTGRSL